MPRKRSKTKKTDKTKKAKKTNNKPGNSRLVMDLKLAKACSHYVRSHILVTLGDRIASPKQIAEELGVATSYVNYHIKYLHREGFIVLVSSRKVRGATEHFYTLNSRVLYMDEREWSQVPKSIRDSLASSALQLFMDEIEAACEAGTFTARSRHHSRSTILVDEQGCRETMEVLSGGLERVLEIGKKAGPRLKKSGERGIPLAIFMIAFESAAGAAEDGGCADD